MPSVLIEIFRIEKSIREDLKFLRECEYIRTELAEKSKGFIFNLKTNKLESVDC